MTTTCLKMSYLTKISGISGRAVRNHEFLGVSSQVINNSRYSSEDVRFLAKTDPASMKRGRGGRSSFSGVVATIFGATGFLGRYVCNRLGKNGTQMIIPYRADPYAVRHLRVMGDLGQILFIPFHLCDEDAIRKAVKHSNVVINLVGREWNSRNFNLHQVNVEGARRIARISKEMGVPKFIHMSALNSNMEHMGYMIPGGSVFLKTKAEGEDAVKEYYPNAVIFRPSDMWGQQDKFLMYFCRLYRYTYNMLPIVNAGKDIWKQPVYVADVGRGIVNAVYNHEARGIYEAVGPRRYELCELIDWFNRVMRRDGDWGYKRTDMKWDPIVKLKAKINEFGLSNPMFDFHADKIEREAVTDTTFDHQSLEDLGVDLTKMEDRITWELKAFKAYAYYLESVGEFDPPAPPKYELP